MGLFGKKSTLQKHTDLFFAAVKMGQSVEYAMKQAIDNGLTDRVFANRADGAEKLYAELAPKVEPEDKQALEKAYNRQKET